MKQTIPNGYRPTTEEVERYLEKWKNLENYVNQESALDKLFSKLCPENVCICDVLLKCSVLNDFYSTNIFNVHAVAKHIVSLNIDKRLANGDPTLVNDIANVDIGGKHHFFYSFATKYCSHHKPTMFAIYDRYVGKVLKHFRSVKKLPPFKNGDLKDYPLFLNIIREFQNVFQLSGFNLKQIDRYLWQLGKEYYYSPSTNKAEN